MSQEDPFNKSQTPETSSESELGPETPVVDVEKLKELITAGELPASVLGLYEEFYTPGDEKPFFKAFAEAEPEKQQAILRALKRTSDKVDSLPPEVADKKFKLSLSAFIVFIYTMFLARTMALRITTDAMLDPGKNEEGALLRILELSGGEVFAHPEKFEIFDFKGFLTKIIYAGHGREVLEHLGEIDPAYHADIVFHCLQVSRQKTGKLEAAYVIDALSACKQLNLEVATQLCRLGFDQVVLEHLEAFSEAAVQETVLLLLKKKKLGLREIFTAVLEMSHKLLVKQILISVCFLDKKTYANLQAPEHEDVLKAVKEIIPNLEEQCSFLRTAMSGNRYATKSIEFIPNSGVLKALLDQHGYPLPPRNKALGSLDIFMSVEYIPDHLLAEMLSIGAWREIYLPGLKELSDASAKKLSKVPFGSVGIGFQTALSPQAKEYFSEARGWFPFLPEYEDRFHVCSDKTADVAAIGLPGIETFPAIKALSVASAQRLLKHQEYHKGTMHLDGLTTLDPEAAEVLLEYKMPLTLNGLTSPKEDEPFDPTLRKLLYRSIKYATKIGAVALRGAIEEMEESGEGDLVLPCLEGLTNETASILARFSKTIHLPKLQSLSVEQAKLLSHHEGLVLDLGLTELSEEVAHALAQHQGLRLTFSALEELSDQATVALSKHEGNLRFPKLARISDVAKEVLSRHYGDLKLDSLARVADAAHDPFFKNRGWYPEESIRSDAASELFVKKGRIEKDIPLTPAFLWMVDRHFEDQELIAGEYVLKPLRLDGRTTLTDEELQWIASYEGTIYLSGLKQIGAREAGYLKNTKGSILFNRDIDITEAGYLEMEGYWKNLFAIFVNPALILEGGMNTLPTAALKYALDRNGAAPVNMAREYTLHPWLLKAFEGYEGDVAFDRVSNVNAEVLPSLAKIKGKISLKGVRSIPNQAARLFQEKEKPVDLSGLTILSEPMAEYLVSQDQELWFNEMTEMPFRVLSILNQNKKDLHFPKVSILHRNCIESLKGPLDRKVYFDRVILIEKAGDEDFLKDPRFSFKGYLAEKERMNAIRARLSPTV